MHDTNDEFKKHFFETSPTPVIILDATTYQIVEINPAAIIFLGYPSCDAAIGRSPIDFSASLQDDGMPSSEKALYYVTKALRDGSAFFEWRSCHLDGTPWDAEGYLHSFSFMDRSLLQITFIDVTERKNAERLQNLLRDLILELNSCNDLAEGADKVLKAVLKLDNIDCGVIYSAHSDHHMLEAVVHSGLSAQSVALISRIGGDTPNFNELLNGEPRYGTCAKNNRINDPIGQIEGLRSFAMIPVVSKGKLIAIMSVASHVSDIIPPGTRTALETIAFQIGGTLLRLRSDRALHENEEIFRQFLKNSPMHIFFKNDKLQPVFLSANFDQLLGRAVEECLGKNMTDLFPSPIAEKMIRDDLAILESGKPMVFTEELNGRFYMTHKFPITLLENIRYMAGYSVDITEQRLAEKALRESVAQFQAFMDNMPSMAIIKDDHYRLLFYNKEYLNFYPGKEWLGKTPQELFPHEIAEMVIKSDQQAFATGSLFVESEQVDLHGNTRLLESRLFTIRREGTPPLLGVIMNDVTERKQSEKALQNAQKLESIGLLAGGIAHDFNNLLGGIFGYIDLARQDPMSVSSNTYLSKAIATIERARSLTLQLLTFSKGGTPVKKRENLKHHLRDTVQFALSGSSISCTFSIDEDLWICECDKNQIGQVVDNIIINAIQAMPQGGTIEVSARNVHGFIPKSIRQVPGDFIQIAIKDEGIGIPKNYLPHIFDPFFTTKPKGHGLGLATCFSIMNKHAGSIDVKSEPGNGSTFYLYLPAQKITDAMEVPVSKSTHTGSGLFLIMDDERVMQETIGEMLESFGYTVAVTGNGRAAIDLCTTLHKNGRRIAGMLFDLTIPGGMGGKEAITEIRPLFPNVPIIVASGYADDQVMAHPQKYLFNDSIRKPFTQAELVEVLNRTLQHT